MGILIQNTGSSGIRKFINSLLAPLQYINNLFYAFYVRKSYDVKFTGQIIYMKKYLNDQFDPVNQRIYITTNTGDLSIFIYRESEDDGEYMYSKSEDDGFSMQRKGESISDTHFTVYVPSSLSYNAALFNAYIEAYRLEPLTYNIQTF